MNGVQAKQMLKQVDCHGIPRGFNGGYSELYKYCLESIEKLDKIEQIVNCELIAGRRNYKSCYNAFYEIVDVIQDREVLENE